MQLPQHHVHAHDTLFTLFVTTSWTPYCDRSAGYYSAEEFPVNIFEMKSKALLFFGKENTRPPPCDMRYDHYLVQGWASGTGVIERTYGHYMYAVIRSSTAIVSDVTALYCPSRTVPSQCVNVR